MQLEEVQFNHDPSSATHDAITITIDGSAGAVVAPEWQRFPVKRQPAAYARDAVSGPVTIKARFSGAPASTTRTIRAVDATTRSAPTGCAGLIIWIVLQLVNALFGSTGHVRAKKVLFDGSGNSALETFNLHSSFLTPAGFVSRRNIVWKWQYKQGNSWIDFDASEHVIYIILDIPTAPWVQSGDATQLPWAVALDVACLWAIGTKTKDEVAAAITLRVNRVPNVSYTPMTMFDGTDRNGVEWYLLMSFLTHLGRGAFQMNCTDCADAVTTLSNLLGCNLAEGQFFHLDTRPFLTLSGNPNNFADWVTFDWDYHEICWLNDFSSNTVWDGCLQLDMSNNRAVYEAHLAVKMTFDAGNPDDYKPQLVASGSGTLGSFVRHRKVSNVIQVW